MRNAKSTRPVVFALLTGLILAAHPALAMLVGDLATSPATSRMALAPLSPTAVRELADPAYEETGVIHKLRAKLETDPNKPLFKTMRGVGYQLL